MAPGGQESAPCWVVPFRRSGTCLFFTQSGLSLGLRGRFKKAFEIGSLWHVPQEPLVVSLILVTWSSVCAWE